MRFWERLLIDFWKFLDEDNENVSDFRLTAIQKSFIAKLSLVTNVLYKIVKK